MSLLELVRTSVRVATRMTDAELEMWIAAAKADMLRVGVRPSLVSDESTMDPLVRSAVVNYCKGNYGYDNEEADRFLQIYERTVIALLNSTANEEADDPVAPFERGRSRRCRCDERADVPDDITDVINGDSDGDDEP